MSEVLDAPATPQKKKSIPPSPSAFTRLRAMTRKVVEPFTGTTARQNPGTGPDTDELGSRPDSEDHLPASPTPKEKSRSRQRSGDPSSGLVNVPSNTSNDARMTGNSLHQFQSENSSQRNSAATVGPKISGPPNVLSASSGLPEKSYSERIEPFSKFTHGRPAKTAHSGVSAILEPSPSTPRTRNQSKGVSEVSETVSHAEGALQGRQNPSFQSKRRFFANSAPIGAPLEPPQAPLTSPLHPKPISKKGNSSQSGQIGVGHQEQSAVGTRRIAGLPASNPSRLGHHAQSGSQGQSGAGAVTTQPQRTPQTQNFFAPLEEFPALPPADPSYTPSAPPTAQRRRRNSSGSEVDHTVKMRLLRRSDKLSSPPRVDKLHASNHRANVTFAPPPLPAQNSDRASDVDMPLDRESSTAEDADGEDSAAPIHMTYAQATLGDTQLGDPPVSPAAPKHQPPPLPSANSHHVAIMIHEAEHLLTTALGLIEKATSLGGILSPKLKQILGNLGSTVIEEELLKKVGDLVESKLAAFANAAHATPSAPASAGQTTVKSANPVPIQPTRNNPPPPKSRPIPKSSAVRHHPARLIIQVMNPESCREKPPVLAAREAANQALEQLGVGQRVAGLTYSAAGNIVAITRPPHSAQDLIPHSLVIAKAILGEEVRCVGRPDVPWFRVQVNTVPVRFQGTIIDPSFVLTEIRWALGDVDYPSINSMAAPPRWMCSPAELANKNHASVVFSFLKEEDAHRFREAGAYLICGKWCKTATYEDRPQVRYCANCWSMEHPTTACRRQLPRCRVCAQNHDTEAHQCEDCTEATSGCAHIPLLCCNCKGPHMANAYDCPERKRKLGQFAKKTSAPVNRQTASTAVECPPGWAMPSATGSAWQTVPPAGGRKTQKKGKSKAKPMPAPQPAPAPATVTEDQPQPGPSVQPSHTVRRAHSDPNLTSNLGGYRQSNPTWGDCEDDAQDQDMEVDAQSIFGVPVPTGDDDAPDLV
jgi:hypothetical protein